MVHDQHDEVDGLPADLQPKAASLNREECRIAPALDSAATGNSAAILRAENETRLKHGWHHGHALGRPHNLVRNTGIRSGLNFLQNCCGRLEATSGRIIVFFGGKAEAGHG